MKSKSEPLFVSGIFWGLAFWIRQTTLLTFALVIGAMIVQTNTTLSQRIYEIIKLLFGFVLIITGFSLVALLLGYWPDFIDQAFIYNFYYLKVVPEGQSAILHMLRVFGTTLLPTLFLVGIAIINIFRHQKVVPIQLSIIAWFIGSLAAALISRRFFGHYFIEFIAPLVLTAGYGLDWLSAIAVKRVKKSYQQTSMMILLLGLIFVPIMGTQMWYLYRLFNWYRLQPAPVEELASKLRMEFPPSTTLVGASPDVLFLSGYKSGSRYFYSYPLDEYYSPGYAEAQDDKYLSAFREVPPQLIYGSSTSVFIELLPQDIIRHYEQVPGIPNLWRFSNEKP